MDYYVLTLFPEMVEGAMHTSIIERGISNGYINLKTLNIRDYTNDKHGKVDDYPYGGGAGMLMQPEPVYQAYLEAVKECKSDKPRVLYMTPQGKTFSQSFAKELAKEEELIFLCGHYEGIDERVLNEIVTDYVSIGDYVLTGGELPAMVMMDTISRLVEGVLKNEDSAVTETFYKDLLEYPQYTRPSKWHDVSVPQELLAGDHKKVEIYREQLAVEKTKKLRPDLYKKYIARVEAIDRLLKDKNRFAYIDMIESLRVRDGEIVWNLEGDILVLDRQTQQYYFYGDLDRLNAVVDQIDSKYSYPILVSGCNEERLHSFRGYHAFMCGVYTERTMLSPTYECRLERNGNSILGYDASGNTIGAAAITKEGFICLSADTLAEYKSALYGACINLLLERGCKPYFHVYNGMENDREVLEKLNVHFARQESYIINF